MTDIDNSIKQLAKGTSIIFVGSILSQPLSLLGKVIMIRALSPSNFGEIMLSFSIVSTVGTIFLLGIPSGVTRLVTASETENKINELLKSGYILAFLGGILGSLSIYIFRFRISELMEEPRLAALIPIFSFILVLRPISTISISGLRSYKLGIETTIAKDYSGKIFSLLVLVLFVYLSQPYVGAILYLITPPIAVGIVSSFYLVKNSPMKPSSRGLPDRSSISEIISFSWPLAFEGAFVLIMTSLDVLMIGYFLTSYEVGLYEAIRPLTRIIIMLLTAGVFFYLPIATEHYEEGDYSGLNTIFTTLTKWITLGTFPIVLTFILYSEDVIRAFYSAEYIPASAAFIVLTIGTFLRVIVGPNGATIKAIDKTRIDLLSSAAGAITNIILNVVLIPRYGIIGAAIATGSGFVVFNTIELIFIYRSIGVHPFSRNTIKPILLTAGVVLIISELLNIRDTTFIHLLLISMAIVLIHSIAIYATNSLEETDMLIIDAGAEKLGINIHRKLNSLPDYSEKHD